MQLEPWNFSYGETCCFFCLCDEVMSLERSSSSSKALFAGYNATHRVSHRLQTSIPMFLVSADSYTTRPFWPHLLKPRVKKGSISRKWINTYLRGYKLVEPIKLYATDLVSISFLRSIPCLSRSSFWANDQSTSSTPVKWKSGFLNTLLVNKN